MREIVCITTYPPRECGIATFSDDQIKSILQKFKASYSIQVCALESETEKHKYPEQVKYTLNTSQPADYPIVAGKINGDNRIELVLIQHEFGLFGENQADFLQFINQLSKPVILVFHTVLSSPTEKLKTYVQEMVAACSAVVVMTQTSAHILQKEYGVDLQKLNVIPHGTHLVSHQDKKTLKEKYRVSGRRILATFGLLSAGKSIETTLKALPDIIRDNPTVLFLIIGKTHPTVIKIEGETYREMLESKIQELNLSEHVKFINSYLDLPTLLEYLQMTDIYLFTSSDPNQAVSGTFVYALSCGCPIVATPIPHALEMLNDRSGIIFDFKNYNQLSCAVNRLLSNEPLRSKMRINGLQKIMATAWENSAIAYALLFKKVIRDKEALQYSMPELSMSHLKRMSRSFGIIQFSKGNRPDIKTGYTLDDNARALTVMCRYFNETGDVSCKKYIRCYLYFIRFCLQSDGRFLNYVDKERRFTPQNWETELNDSNGRAVCALGYFIAHSDKLPKQWGLDAIQALTETLPVLTRIHSPRSIAYILKGLYFYGLKFPSAALTSLVDELAGRLSRYYTRTAIGGWLWFENSLTYANGVLPEGMLYAYLHTGNELYRDIAKESFDFLLLRLFPTDQIRVVSNQGWLHKGKEKQIFGEQPIDVACTVVVLSLFFDVFRDPSYIRRQRSAFNWFLGENHLHQTIYNPATGGCYDGLEEHNANMNQGAESTVSYLIARLTMNTYPDFQ